MSLTVSISSSAVLPLLVKAWQSVLVMQHLNRSSSVMETFRKDACSHVSKLPYQTHLFSCNHLVSMAQCLQMISNDFEGCATATYIMRISFSLIFWDKGAWCTIENQMDCMCINTWLSTFTHQWCLLYFKGSERGWKNSHEILWYDLIVLEPYFYHLIFLECAKTFAVVNIGGKHQYNFL